MGGLSMTTPTPSTMRCSMLTQWWTTPTIPASGFGWTSPKTRHGLREQMDLINQFIAEFCMLNPDKVPLTPSQGCFKMTSYKSSTPIILCATLSTSPSIDLQMKDFEPTCANSKSYTTSKICCLPPFSTPTTKSRPIKKEQSLSPTSSYRPELHHRLDLTSLGILKHQQKEIHLIPL